MAKNSYDLIVLGGGPGGYVAAIRAAQLGFRTAVIEKDRLGGVCLNWGCVPSKALLSNARVLNTIRSADRWGISVSGYQFDIEKIIGRSREVADTISKGVAFLMKKNKIDVLEGTGRIEARGRVSVRKAPDGQPEVFETKHLIIATGARARAIPGIDVDGERVLTSRHALAMARIPKSIAIIGAGAIGCEFGFFYRSFGAEVTIIEMMEHALPLEDEEVSVELERAFKKQGTRILVRHKVAGLEKSATGVRLRVEGPDGKIQLLEAEVVLQAVGVTGNTEDLGLEEAGVEVDRNTIKVNQWYQTAAPGIHAIGDVIGPPWLAHVASHEGIACVEKIAGLNPHPVDYTSVPACTYCQPQVASVGLTEKNATAKGYQVKVGKFPFRVLGKARAAQAEEGFVKLVFDSKYGELLGAHIIGEEATELIAELVTAKNLETTYFEILKSMHAHPTLSEAVMEAAGAAFGEQIHL